MSNLQSYNGHMYLYCRVKETTLLKLHAVELTSLQLVKRFT